MLDAFEIVTTSGVVLWSKSYVPVGATLINSLIKDVFIEEKAASSSADSDAPKPVYRKDGYTLKWTTAKDLGLIFVVFWLECVVFKRQADSICRLCINRYSVSRGSTGCSTTCALYSPHCIVINLSDRTPPSSNATSIRISTDRYRSWRSSKAKQRASPLLLRGVPLTRPHWIKVATRMLTNRHLHSKLHGRHHKSRSMLMLVQRRSHLSPPRRRPDPHRLPSTVTSSPRSMDPADEGLAELAKPPPSIRRRLPHPETSLQRAKPRMHRKSPRRCENGTQMAWPMKTLT